MHEERTMQTACTKEEAEFVLLFVTVRSVQNKHERWNHLNGHQPTSVEKGQKPIICQTRLIRGVPGLSAFATACESSS